jgi:adenylate cyclase class 2
METKILDIDIQEVEKELLTLGAKKVFDDHRVITYFKNQEGVEPFLKLTEEGEKLKLSSQNTTTHKEIKLFISRKDECIQLLATLGYRPISGVKARRISYELETIDFDIDQFPGIPAFLEIDLGDNPSMNLDEIVLRLNIKNNKKGQMSTPQIVGTYGKDYFEVYKLAQ